MLRMIYAAAGCKELCPEDGPSIRPNGIFPPDRSKGGGMLVEAAGRHQSASVL